MSVRLFVQAADLAPARLISEYSYSQMDACQKIAGENLVAHTKNLLHPCTKY